MEYSQRPSQYPLHAPLEDRFEVLKEIGDGSFGSVVLARTRTAGSTVARRGTLVSRLLWLSWTVLTLLLGRHQDHEENIRVFQLVS